MRKVILIVLALFGHFLVNDSVKWIPSFAGPYQIVVRRVWNESSEFNSTGGFWCRLYTTHPRRREKQYIWGRCWGDHELTDEYKADIRVSTWSNNEWKRNAMVMKFDRGCSTILQRTKSLSDLVFPPDRKCPLPVIMHKEVKNRTFEVKFPDVPILPYGRYLFTLAFLMNNITTGLVVADADVIPQL